MKRYMIFFFVSHHKGSRQKLTYDTIYTSKTVW